MTKRIIVPGFPEPIIIDDDDEDLLHLDWHLEAQNYIYTYIKEGVVRKKVGLGRLIVSRKDNVQYSEVKGLLTFRDGKNNNYRRENLEAGNKQPARERRELSEHTEWKYVYPSEANYFGRW